MKNTYKLTLLGLFIAVLAVIMAVSVQAQTTSNGSDDLVSTTDGAATTTNGSDDSVVSSTASLTSNGGDDYIGTESSGTGTTTATTTNGGDDYIAIDNPGTGGSNATTTNGGDDYVGSTTHSISISITGSGSVTCVGGIPCPTSVVEGTQIHLSFTPASGFKISSLTQNGAEVTSCIGNTTTCGVLTNVYFDLNFVVVFESTNKQSSSSGGGGSGSFSSGSGSRIAFATTSPILALANPVTSSCPLLTTFIKAGAVNNSAEVAKLQSFLNSKEGTTLTVNGTYDTATQNAVRAFQSKYLSQVMGPWGATQSSGFVYITTQKMINQIACNSPFILSAGDLAVINSYKTRLIENQPAIGSETTPATSTEVGPVLETGNEVSSTTEEIGSNVGSSQTAAVGNTSILARFWNFIVGLFK